MARQHTFKAKHQSKGTKILMPPEVPRPPSVSHFEEPKESPKDLAPRARRKMDPITESLGCGERGYFHKMRWEWFFWMDYGVKTPLEVSRYYDKRCLALDMNISEAEQTLIPMKKQLLESHGIRYFHITDINSFEKMLNEIGGN